jgi:hypothetical protein
MSQQAGIISQASNGAVQHKGPSSSGPACCTNGGKVGMFLSKSTSLAVPNPSWQVGSYKQQGSRRGITPALTLHMLATQMHST